MNALCGADCQHCGYGQNNGCRGCEASNGCPFGKPCFIAGYIKAGGKDQFARLKSQLADELNALNIPGLPEIKQLYPINGAFVNLEYPLPGGQSVKLLNDKDIYLANQVECEFNDGEIIRWYGLVANMDFLLVSEYGPNGTDPELILFKKR